MLIAEELLLLALDDERGTDTTWGSLDYGLAGAILLDLSLAGAITVDEDGKIAATGSVDDELLADAMAAIRGDDKPRDAKHWVTKLPGKLKPMRERIAGRLVGAGVLREERGGLFGSLRRTRYPEADPAPERELRARLVQTLVTGAEPDPRTALLVSVLQPLDLVKHVVAKDDRKEARKRAKVVADQGVVGTGLGRAVEDMQAAVMVSIVAASVVTTSAANS